MDLGSPNTFYQQLLAGSSGSIAAAFAVSVLLGAVHGASPGHGKTLVVASLLGSRGSLSRVLLLAITVALTHTVGVLLLAFIVLTANNSLLPQQVTPFITLAADVLVVLFGADLIRRAAWARSASRAAAAAPHEHPHVPVPAGLEFTRGYTISIGIIGGLVPNGTALVVLLIAIAFHEVALGLLLVAAFGLGIAVVLGTVGIATVLVRSRGGELVAPGGRVGGVLTLLPLLSGVAVFGVGIFLTFTALSGL
jgi:ABC-type nickel/cobalt efflux system permease component RcnA